jgi:hypothetical protein
MNKRTTIPYRTVNALALLWTAYKRVTGYEKAILQRKTGLKIQSTAFPSEKGSVGRNK